MTVRRLAHVAALAAAVVLGGFAPRAAAGPYGDDLGKCLVSATTAEEKNRLIRWIFSMMARHPDVQGACAITTEQQAAISKEVGQLFQRLITESCVTQARTAIRYEGNATIEQAFSVLGQVSMRELMTSPKVAEGLSEFTSYLDEAKLKAALAEPPPKE